MRMSCDHEVEVGKMAVLWKSCLIVFVAKTLALQWLVLITLVICLTFPRDNPVQDSHPGLCD